VPDKFEIVLVGYSGHGYVVGEAALAAALRLAHYADRTKAMNNPYDLNYLGFEGDENFTGWDHGYGFILGIGDNKTREKIATGILGRKELLTTVIHPSASIALKTEIGRGVFVARNVSVSPLAAVGDFSILNTGSIIEHENKIGRAVHIAPGAVLAGNVEVGDRSFIGANAVVKQGIRIGMDVTIGAGSVILTDVPDGATVVGNPARRIS
jgi:sugar O-acyltransferase (sialic acid O-acetyltransferase NeuD family)